MTNETNIDKLEQALESFKILIRAEKLVQKHSDKYRVMELHNTTDKQRARASDKLDDACHERNVLRDNLHSDLVDAGLCPALEPSNYTTREIVRSCGLGHRITVKYTPKTPAVIKHPDPALPQKEKS